MKREQIIPMVGVGQMVRLGIEVEEDVAGTVLQLGDELVLQLADGESRSIEYTSIESIELVPASSRCSSLVADES